MTIDFWKKLNFLTGLMAIGVVFGFATFAATLEIKDLDLWLHLGMGRFISENGFVPSHDVLSATIAGKPWVNHEWLFQVLVFHIQKIFSFDGLIAMQAIIVGLTFFALLLMRFDARRLSVTAVLMLLFLLVYQSRFTIRPDIFSLLFLVLFYWILTSSIERRWSLYVLFVLQVLWTNMHGFFLFGPLLTLMILLAETGKRHLPMPEQWSQIGRLTDVQYSCLKKVALVIPLACLINPLTVKGAIYPLKVFVHIGTDAKIFFQHIYELQKPITKENIWTVTYGPYKALIVLSAYSFILNRRRIDIKNLIIWMFFLVFSLSAIRNLIFFAAMACIVFLENVRAYQMEDVIPFRFPDPKFKELTGIIVKVILIAWVMNQGLEASTNGYYDFDVYKRKSEYWGVSKRSFPYKGVDFLVRNNIKGNFFNDFNSGAYLVGRTYPQIKVFIDGRTEEYGAKFFEEYLKIWREGDVKLFNEYAKKYNITGAFLNNNNQLIPVKSLKMFHGFKDWSLVYFDDDAMIFLKQTPQNKPFIDKYKIDLSAWKPKPIDLMRIGTSKAEPFMYTNRAYILQSLGYYDGALKECRMALSMDAGYNPAHKIMGGVYYDQKKYHQAFIHLRMVVSFSSKDTQTRTKLALTYEALKNYPKAIDQFERVIDYAPTEAAAYFNLARAFALNGQLVDSISVLKKARNLDKKDKIDVEKIRDIILKRNPDPQIKKNLEDVIKL